MSQTDPAPVDPHQEISLAASEEQNKQIMKAFGKLVERAEEKNRFLPGLFPRDTGAERLTDLDRHDCSAVVYGMVDRGHVLRYGHNQSSHCRPLHLCWHDLVCSHRQ